MSRDRYDKFLIGLGSFVLVTLAEIVMCLALSRLLELLGV